jgi:hypothetical protein
MTQSVKVETFTFWVIVATSLCRLLILSAYEKGKWCHPEEAWMGSHIEAPKQHCCVSALIPTTMWVVTSRGENAGSKE